MTISAPEKNRLGIADRWDALPGGAKGAIFAAPLVALVAGVAFSKMNNEPAEAVTAAASTVQALPDSGRPEISNEDETAAPTQAPTSDVTAPTPTPTQTPTASLAPSAPTVPQSSPSTTTTTPRPTATTPTAVSTPLATPSSTPQRSSGEQGYTQPRQVTAAPRTTTRRQGASAPRTVTTKPRTTTKTTITPIPSSGTPLAVKGRTYVKAGVECPRAGSNGLAADGLLMVCQKDGSILKWRRA